MKILCNSRGNLVRHIFGKKIRNNTSIMTSQRKFYVTLTYHLFSAGGSKKRASRKAAVETGTGKNSEVDFEWIPKSSLLSTPGG